LAEQLAVPDLKCVPCGAFAALIDVVEVAAATAGNATTAATTVGRTRSLNVRSTTDLLSEIDAKVTPAGVGFERASA
jgi:hypothetical protein